MDILIEIQKEEMEVQNLVRDWHVQKLANFIEELIKKDRAEQLLIHSVVKSLPTKEENNIELEHKLQEYSNDYNFKNLKLDLGYKIGWKECYNSITK